jgi:hypothetical protein
MVPGCRTNRAAVTVTTDQIIISVALQAASVDFGAKLAVSLVDGYAFCEELSWDAYNEGNTLIDSIEKYEEKYGFYPEVVLADKIYRTQENREYCKKRKIRLSGPKLGRPCEESRKDEKRQIYQDSCERNEVEGLFGTGKRKYALDRIMAKLRETSETMILLNLVVLNLEKKPRLLFQIFRWYFGRNFSFVIKHRELMAG